MHIYWDKKDKIRLQYIMPLAENSARKLNGYILDVTSCSQCGVFPSRCKRQSLGIDWHLWQIP